MGEKVPPQKIIKLYGQDSKSIYDEELIDDIGTSLYARVDSMLMVTSSNLGKAICIECRTEIPHNYQRGFITVAKEELDKWLEKFSHSIHRHIDPTTGKTRKENEYENNKR